MKPAQANYEINDMREEMINLVVSILGEIDNKDIKKELSASERLCQRCNIPWKDYHNDEDNSIDIDSLFNELAKKRAIVCKGC